MANSSITECYERFNFEDKDLFDYKGPDLIGLTARRMVALADGMDDVWELIGAIVEQLPNNTDMDRPRALLAGAKALVQKRRDELPFLVAGTLQLMPRSDQPYALPSLHGLHS